MLKKNRKNNDLGFSTRAIHAGQEPAPRYKAIMTPVYLSSTFVQDSPGEYYDGYDYSRTKNPSRSALEDNIAALEGGATAACYSSGCAAADSVLHLLKTGDHIISGDDIYGGTFRLFDQVYAPLGLSVSYVNLQDLSAFEAAIKPETKLLWIESPTNPLLKIADIERLSRIAREHGILVAVDNTFCSPYLQNPLALGADIVLHSSTKYIGGHSDVIGGVLVAKDEELGERIKYMQNAVGSIPSPFDCFLLLRSTKTLSVRMERHADNAEKIAAVLEARDDIERVYYPGLPSHPQYELAKKQMRRGGGMISVVLKGGLERAKKVLESVEIFSLAESLGGVESLIEHPAIMTHATIPAATREHLGITDGLIRLSVGIEEADDLIADLEQALDRS